MVKITLPELGEGINEATISYWHREEGDVVKEGEDLVEMATDKATFNLPAPCSGRLNEVYFHEGDVVKVGDALGVIEK
ncbi:MAG: biotin/lipoyl-containing protein [Candidatus Omnitrophota bacterium]